MESKVIATELVADRVGKMTATRGEYVNYKKKKKKQEPQGCGKFYKLLNLASYASTLRQLPWSVTPCI